MPHNTPARLLELEPVCFIERDSEGYARMKLRSPQQAARFDLLPDGSPLYGPALAHALREQGKEVERLREALRQLVDFEDNGGWMTADDYEAMYDKARAALEPAP